MCSMVEVEARLCLRVKTLWVLWEKGELCERGDEYPN